MSAWIVESKTINRILNSLTTIKDSWVKEKIGGILFAADPTLNLSEGPAEIGKAMYSLNVDAVTARYSGRERDDLPGSGSEYCYEENPCTDVQAYKSLRCWLYQCSEGDVPERPLFKAFEEIGGFIAEKIVSNLPQFEAADWG